MSYNHYENFVSSWRFRSVYHWFLFERSIFLSSFVWWHIAIGQKKKKKNLCPQNITKQTYDIFIFEAKHIDIRLFNHIFSMISPFFLAPYLNPLLVLTIFLPLIFTPFLLLAIIMLFIFIYSYLYSIYIHIVAFLSLFLFYSCYYSSLLDHNSL